MKDLPVRAPRFKPSEGIQHAKRKKPTCSKRNEPAASPREPDHAAVLADLNPKLHSLPLSVPMGVFGEGEERRCLRSSAGVE